MPTPPYPTALIVGAGPGLGASLARVFTRDGAPLRSWGGPGTFTNLSRVAVAPGGDVYATDLDSVKRFSRSGSGSCFCVP